MNDDVEQVAAAIAHRGGLEVRLRLRDALQAELAALDDGPAVAPDELKALVEAAAARADGALWRRALAEAATAELGLALADAVEHPAVLRAHELAGAPPYERPVAASSDVELVPAPDADDPGPDLGPASGNGAAPEAEALRVPAVHLGGIEALRAGENDIELRISPAGLDVLKRSTGAAIGRLEWSEIESIDLPRTRRALRPRGRRAPELHVATRRGRASFELPGLTDEQLRQHLEPMLAQARDTASR